MSEYIDVDVFRRDMYYETFTKDTDMQRWDSGCWIRYKLFENVLEQQLIADVRENIYCENASDNGFLCSVCNFGDFDGFHGYEPRYCPECGAIVMKK